MPRKSTKNRRKPAPAMQWQTDLLDKYQEVRHRFPTPFLLICKVLDITPIQVITDLIDNVSSGSWKREGRDKAKSILIDYMIAHGYGQHLYSEDDIRLLFKELDAVGLLFPSGTEEKVRDLYVAWREEQYKYLFNKWFFKNSRTL